MAKRKRKLQHIAEGHPLWDELAERQRLPDGRIWCPLDDVLWPPELARNLEIDHVDHEGTNDVDNLQLVCPTCNKIKGQRSQAEGRARCLAAREVNPHEWRQAVKRESQQRWYDANREHVYRVSRDRKRELRRALKAV